MQKYDVTNNTVQKQTTKDLSQSDAACLQFSLQSGKTYPSTPLITARKGQTAVANTRQPKLRVLLHTLMWNR